MKLDITAKWLMSFDATPEPSGYSTPRDRTTLARRREAAQSAPLAQEAKKRSRKSSEKAVAGK